MTNQEKTSNTLYWLMLIGGVAFIWSGWSNYYDLKSTSLSVFLGIGESDFSLIVILVGFILLVIAARSLQKGVIEVLAE